MNKEEFKKNLIFGYLTGKRLLPNYSFFSKNYNFGDPLILEKYLNEIRNYILDFNYQISFNGFESIIDKITPAPENFVTILASSALDACGVVFEILSYINDNDQQHIEAISTMATDSVDMYIQEKENLNMNIPESEEKISSHPLMLQERKTQEEIWNYLHRANVLNEEAITALEKLQFNNGMGNLDLPLN